MVWHVGGGQGESGGEKLGELTQGLGYPLREVSEVTVESITYRATDDAGDGTVEGDVNATDFTSQTGTTYAEVLPNYVVAIVHKSILYSYIGPVNVRLGVGGDYVTTSADYIAQGTADHSLLNNLSAADQHPISAVTGLVAEQAQQDQNLVDHETAPDPHPQYALETAVLDNFVAAGYGGIGLDGPTAVPSITGSFQTLTGWDQALISAPFEVVQDYPNNGLVLGKVGVWSINVKVSLTFAEENAGRTLRLRIFNTVTQAVPSTEFVFFVGRNQAGINMNFNVPAEVSAPDVGDLFVIQIASVDSFTNVSNIGSIFDVNHISIALNL